MLKKVVKWIYNLTLLLLLLFFRLKCTKQPQVKTAKMQANANDGAIPSTSKHIQVEDTLIVDNSVSTDENEILNDAQLASLVLDKFKKMTNSHSPIDNASITQDGGGERSKM